MCGIERGIFQGPIDLGHRVDGSASFIRFISRENTITQQDMETIRYRTDGQVQDLNGIANRLRANIDLKIPFIYDVQDVPANTDAVNVIKGKIEQIGDRVQKVRHNCGHVSRIVKTLRNQLPSPIEGEITVNTRDNLGSDVNVKAPIRKTRNFNFEKGERRITNHLPLWSDLIDENTLGNRYLPTLHYSDIGITITESLYYRWECLKGAATMLLFSIFSIAQPIFLMYKNWDEYKAIWANNNCLIVGFEVTSSFLLAPILSIASSVKYLYGAVYSPSVVFKNLNSVIDELPYEPKKPPAPVSSNQSSSTGPSASGNDQGPDEV